MTIQAGRGQRAEVHARSGLRDMLRRARVPEATTAACLRAVEVFGAAPGVTAVGIGYRRSGGVADADAGLCIRVHVRHKRRPGRLGRGMTIPARFDGLATDVIDAEYVPQHAPAEAVVLDRHDRCDPLVPGISISHEKGHTGTLGMFVRGLNDPTAIYLLSAGHVLADTMRPKVGDAIVQPSVGHAREAVVARYSARSLLYDAAVARLAPDVAWRNEVAEQSLSLFDSDFPAIGLVLKKSGLESAVTSARVEGIDSYEGLGPGMFLGPVPADDGRPLAVGGDSGAIWYEESTRRAVGLHVRGNPTGATSRYAIATSVVKLCEALHVDARL